VDTKRGAYVLYFDIKLPLTLQVGSLGSSIFPAGRYAYVGSARRGIAARVLRHKRLALQKEGKLHWHIDYLLINRHTELAGETVMENEIECTISKRIAKMSGVTVPVPGFGSSDCRAKCRAHLYLLTPEFCLPIQPASAHLCAAHFARCPSREKACADSPQFEGTLQ
jgi:Uri superfamily endonuclease